MNGLLADARSTLTTWHPHSDSQRELKAHYLDHLERHPDGLTRDCHPDHITASAIVVSHDRSQVLLNLHGRYRRWMQFGGHCESGDRTLAQAALRETSEESGIDGLRLVSELPAQLSRHEVACGPIRPSHHLDVRYVVVAPADSEAIASAESLDVRWFARDTLPDDLEPEVRQLVALTRWL